MKEAKFSDERRLKMVVPSQQRLDTHKPQLGFFHDCRIQFGRFKLLLGNNSHAQAPRKPDPEFEPHACARFETLVESAAKMGPRPHKATPPQRKVAVKKKRAKAKK